MVAMPLVQPNQAAVLSAPGTITLEERPEPVLREGMVIVAVTAVGVCGSDVHYLEHGRIGDFVVDGPLVLGHEAGGVIVGLGPGVSGISIGQRVAIEPGVPDGTCDQCRVGRYNLCPDVRFLATPPVDGAFMRRIGVPVHFVHPIPDGLSDDAAALIEPLAVAVAGTRRAGIGVGDRVLVTGAGPIGVLMAAVAQRAGAADVTVTEADPIRLERARRFLGGIVVTPDALDGRTRFEAFIECSGAAAAVEAGLAALVPAGRAVLVGMGAPVMDLPVGLIQVRELVVTGSFRYAHAYRAAIALAASGAIDLDALVDRHFPLAETAHALVAGQADRSIMKTVVTVQG